MDIKNEIMIFSGKETSTNIINVFFLSFKNSNFPCFVLFLFLNTGNSFWRKIELRVITVKQWIHLIFIFFSFDLLTFLYTSLIFIFQLYILSCQSLVLPYYLNIAGFWKENDTSVSLFFSLSRFVFFTDHWLFTFICISLFLFWF